MRPRYCPALGQYRAAPGDQAVSRWGEHVKQYVLRRILTAVILVLAVAVIVRSILFILPGDPVQLVLGSDFPADPEAVQRIRTQLGLDRPLLAQLGEWISGLLKLDFGTSFRTQRSVAGILGEALPRSLILMGGGLLVGLLLGVPSGVLSAVNRNRLPDTIATGMATLGISTPEYVTGSLLILLFAFKLRWLPAAGYVAFADNPTGFFLRLVLPVVTVGFGKWAIITRMARSTMLDTLRRDYIRTARSKGISERRVVYRHALRNAWAPVIAVTGVELGGMLGRTVIVEFIFNWPGLSTTLLQAIRVRDYPVVQGVMLVISVFFILANLLTDLLYAKLDPRITYH